MVPTEADHSGVFLQNNFSLCLTILCHTIKKSLKSLTAQAFLIILQYFYDVF